MAKLAGNDNDGERDDIGAFGGWQDASLASEAALDTPEDLVRAVLCCHRAGGVTESATIQLKLRRIQVMRAKCCPSM